MKFPRKRMMMKKKRMFQMQKTQMERKRPQNKTMFTIFSVE